MNEEQAAFAFTPEPGEAQALVLRNGAISAFTFGAWRFWFKTRYRRMIWGRSTLGGDPFEYDGKALELLRGTIIAILLLAFTILAFNLLLGFVGLAFWKSVSPTASAALTALAILPVLEFARFRARRYRLLRTRWRGLRFGMEGSSFAFLRLWAGWSLAMVATLGVARPWLRVARERYMTSHMFYGDAKFSFEGDARTLLIDWLRVWFAVLAGFGALTALRQIRFFFAYGGVRVDVMSFLYPACGVLIAWLIFRFWCEYRAAELRLFMNGRRLKDVRVACSVQRQDLTSPALTLVGRAIPAGILLATLLFSFASLMLWLAVAVEGADPATVRLSLDPALLDRFATFGGRVIFLVAAWINYALSVLFLIWLFQAVYYPRAHGRLMAASLATGLTSLASVRQRPAAEQIEAEGFADALDASGL
ncbi:MAG: DUF898 family protein [Paracoccaceae bacterium]